MKVVFLQADQEELMASTSSHWLCGVPARVLERHGTDVRVRSIHEVHIDHSIIDWADVVVVERNTFVITELAIEVWRRRGKRVLLRFDDAYGVMPEHSPTYDSWHKLHVRGALGHERFLQSLPLFDSYSTPSLRLTNAYIEHNPNGVWIPNRPDLLNFPQPKPLRTPKRFNVVWGGSMPHRQSWVGSKAAQGVRGALESRPDEFRLLLLCDRPWFGRIFKVPYIRYPWVPIDAYRQRLRAVAHIGLAPLYGPYDACRSWIKVLVYALLGIPWLASDAPPYRGCKGGWLVPDDEVEWEAAIGEIALPDNYARERQEGLDWSWSQGLDDYVDEWMDWLEGKDG